MLAVKSGRTELVQTGWCCPERGWEVQGRGWIKCCSSSCVTAPDPLVCASLALGKLGQRSKVLPLMAQPADLVLPSVRDFLCLQAWRNVLAEALFESIILPTNEGWFCPYLVTNAVFWNRGRKQPFKAKSFNLKFYSGCTGLWFLLSSNCHVL